MNIYFRKLAKSIKKPFLIYYNPYTSSIEIKENKDSDKNIRERLTFLKVILEDLFGLTF